jgi:hypothetical protein
VKYQSRNERNAVLRCISAPLNDRAPGSISVTERSISVTERIAFRSLSEAETKEMRCFGAFRLRSTTIFYFGAPAHFGASVHFGFAQ